MRWLQLAEVLELHRRLLAQRGGASGLRDLELLEASLALPRQSFAGADLYPGLIAKPLRSASLSSRTTPLWTGTSASDTPRWRSPWC